MRKIETIIVTPPTKRSADAVLMATPKSAPRAHRNKKAYDRKRNQKTFD